MSDSTLVARKLAETPIVTVATPAYLAEHGTPATPAELDRHACIAFAPGGAPIPWGFAGRFGGMSHQPRGAFRTNDAEQIRAAVLANLGLAHTPGWLFAAEIAAGAVRAVLRDYEPAMLPISAVHPGGRFVAGKVRVFIDFLAEIFAAEPSLRGALPVGRPTPRAPGGSRGRNK
jgi:LysR family transcriptional regulator for bpeEF and oprC